MTFGNAPNSLLDFKKTNAFIQTKDKCIVNEFIVQLTSSQCSERGHFLLISDVRLKNYGREMIEVIDNGCGVHESDFQALSMS